MNSLFLGEVVGKAGFTCVKKGLKCEKYKNLDLISANAEGVQNSRTVSINGIHNLLGAGVHILTGAEKLFTNPGAEEILSKTSKLLRPLNMASTVPGKGIGYLTVNEQKVAVINLAGEIDMRIRAICSPIVSLNWILPKLEEQGIKQIFVVFHAQATAEKKALLYYLDGKVTAVVGTHTKVLTADEQISEKGTAFISDLGRCGSQMSVGGMLPENEIMREKLGRNFYSVDCFDDLEMQGLLIKSDENGKALSVQVVREKIKLTQDEINKFTAKKVEAKDDN